MAMVVKPKMAETKFYAYGLLTEFPAVSTTVSTLDLLKSISQGDEINQRDGRAIRALAVELTGGCLVGGQVNLVTDDVYNFFRLGFIRCNVGTDLSGFNMNALADPRAFPGVLEWLHDEVIAMPVRGLDSVGYVPNPIVVKRSVKINKVLTFTGSAINTQSGETVLMYCVSDSAAAAHPGFTNGLVTLWFCDN